MPFDPNGPNSPIVGNQGTGGADQSGTAGGLPITNTPSTGISSDIFNAYPNNPILNQTMARQALISQGNAQQPKPPPPKKHGGWSLNPLKIGQDIGQAWHDVETHTLSPALKAQRRLYTDVISHPVSALLNYGASVDFNAHGNLGQDIGGLNPFSNANQKVWINSWHASNHISPGQELVLDFHNTGFFTKSSGGPGATNPQDPQAVADLFNKNHWGNRIVSGMADFGINFLDPTAAALRGVGKGASLIKNAPVGDAASVDRIMNSGRTQRMINWVVEKNNNPNLVNSAMANIAEHSMLKQSPMRYQMAGLLAGAKSRDEVEQILRIGFGDEQAYDHLAMINTAMAYRTANLLAPPETMEKFALTSSPWNSAFEWLKEPEKAKVASARAELQQDMGRVQQILDAKGMLANRTTSSALAEHLADAKTRLKYANTHDVDRVFFMGHNMYATPIRIYQSLTDRPVAGVIDHTQDHSVETVRAVLNKSGVLLPDEKTALLHQYAGAPVEGRAQVWDHVISANAKAIDEHFGLPGGTAANLLAEGGARSRALADAITQGEYGRLQGLSPVGEEGLNTLPTATSEVLMHPGLADALRTGSDIIPNFRHLETSLRAMQRSGTLGRVLAVPETAKDTLEHILDKVYGIWKPLVLLSMHRAYNHIGDDYIRGVAKLGALTTIENAAVGTSNFIRNRVEQFTLSHWVRNAEASYQMARQEAKAELEGLKAQVATQTGRNIPDDLRVSPEAVAAAQARYDALRAQRPPGVRANHRLGSGEAFIKGTNMKAVELFGGPNAPALRDQMSSHSFWQYMVDDAAHREHAIMTNQQSQLGLLTAVESPAEHAKAWEKYVARLVSTPEGRMAVEGKEAHEIMHWLDRSTAGQARMRALHMGDPEAVANTLLEMTAKYLPTDEMRDVALRGQFTAKFAQIAMPGVSSRPELPRSALAMVHGDHPAQGYFRKTTDFLMKLTGTLPDDVLVRHPVANALYKANHNRIVTRMMNQLDTNKLTAAQVDQASQEALKFARMDLRNLVYDVSRFNDAGHVLRFVSPFFNAWFNAMSSWSRLFAENPGLLARSFQAKRMLWNNPLAIDRSTGKQADDKTSMDNLMFVMHLPQPLAKYLGGQTTLPFDAKTVISPTYADSVGNPGFGPLVTIPANMMAKSDPRLADSQVMHYILGNFITSNSVSQLIPSTVRQAVGVAQLLHVAGNPSDNQDYAKLLWSIYQEQQYDYLNGKRSAPPVWKDIEKQAAVLTAINYTVNRLMPLGFKPQPQHQYYIDEFKQMQSQDPKNALQDFYDKHGAAAMVYTVSLHSNSSGIPATMEGAVAAKKYSKLLAQYPELGAAIIGPEGNGAFNEAAYQWEVANGLRGKMSPQDAAKRANENMGWAAFDKMSAAIQAQLQMRGLTSIHETGAEDLRVEKKKIVDALSDPQSHYYNPDWYAKYDSFNQNNYQNRIVQLLNGPAQDPTILANPLRSDMRSLNAYAQIRDITFYALQQRPKASLNAKANWDIAQWYDQQVSALIARDTKFGPLYARYLAKDDFKEPL